MSKRTKTAQFRVNAEEDGHLRKAAEDAGMKLSDYLRAVCLNRSVVVVAEQGVVVIPAATSSSEADQELMRRLEQKIAVAGQEENPAPQGSPSPIAGPSAAKPPSPAPTPAAASGSPPAAPAALETSPGGGDGMVGASASQELPAVASQASGHDDRGAAAGAIPGSGETVLRTHQEEHAPGEFEPGGPDACPHCGGTEGRHQSFCEEIRGEPPVEEPEPEAKAPPQPAPETREQFVERRVNEGEMRVVAEAEWRQQESGVIETPPPPPAPPAAPPQPQPPADRRQVCPSCGTLKLPEAQCADCGRRPE